MKTIKRLKKDSELKLLSECGLNVVRTFANTFRIYSLYQVALNQIAQQNNTSVHTVHETISQKLDRIKSRAIENNKSTAGEGVPVGALRENKGKASRSRKGSAGGGSSEDNS